MIIIKPIGGLASQFHKYAVGMALAVKYDTELKLDLSHYKNKDFSLYRDYELGNFNINCKEATELEISLFKIKYEIVRILTQFGLIRHSPHMKTIKNIDDFCALGANEYIKGEWILGDVYYGNIYDKLSDSFRLKGNMTELAASYAEAVSKCNSVSLHFRRGDFVENDGCKNFYEECSFKYYKDALGYVVSKISTPELFIFSDDIEWVKNNFHVDYTAHFVSVNSCEDIMLMSLCKNNIIANSGYSWIAACFNKNPNKIIVAPKRWVRDDAINALMLEHMISKDWIFI